MMVLVLQSDRPKGRPKNHALCSVRAFRTLTNWLAGVCNKRTKLAAGDWSIPTKRPRN
jgi:hypothetical protein